MNVAEFNTGSHGYRNDTSIVYIGLHGCTDLANRELVSCKITLHELFTGLSYCIHHGFTIDIQVCFAVFRDLALFSGADTGKSTTCHLHNVDVAYEFLIFTHWLIERSNLLAVQLCQLLNNFTEGCMVYIHLRYKEHTGQFVFFTELPCFLSTNFHTGFTRYHDDRCICCCHCFFCFSYKIEIAWCIQQVDLRIFPDQRYNGCVD